MQALLQSTVQQQEAAIEKQYILAIEKHSHKCQELLDAQVWMCIWQEFPRFSSSANSFLFEKNINTYDSQKNGPSLTLFPQHATKHKYLKMLYK